LQLPSTLTPFFPLIGSCLHRNLAEITGALQMFGASMKFFYYKIKEEEKKMFAENATNQIMVLCPFCWRIRQLVVQHRESRMDPLFCWNLNKAQTFD